MKNSSISAPTHFSVEIESLRGIAALFVLFGHLYLFVNLPAFLSSPIKLVNQTLAAMFNPQPAVLLFFTISGLVLGRQLRKNPIEGFPSFIAYLFRRGFRLMPLIWVSIFFAYFLHSYGEPSSLPTLYANLHLYDISLNIPLWSIQVELWCSVFFPLLFWMFRTSGIIYNFLMFLGFVGLSYYANEPIFMQFWVFFHAGLLVDLLSANIKGSKFKNPLILLFAYLLFIFAPSFSIGERNWGYGHWQSWVLPEILACPLILFFVVHNKNTLFNTFLRLSGVRYLGKISFSVYLLHFPLLQFMLLKYPVLTLTKLIVFSCSFTGLTLLISSLAYHWIEIPFIRLGKKLYTFILADSYSKTMDDRVNPAL